MQSNEEMLRRFQERLARVPERVKVDLDKAVVRNANRIAKKIKAAAPRDTGALADSIKVTGPGQTTPAYSQPGGGRKANELEAIITVGNTDVRYPHLLEYGTSQTAAQPFFWSEIREILKSVKRSLKTATRKAVKNEAGRGSDDE